MSVEFPRIGDTEFDKAAGAADLGFEIAIETVFKEQGRRVAEDHDLQLSVGLLPLVLHGDAAHYFR